MNRRIWKALGIAVCMLALAAPRAMAKTHRVGSEKQFKDAVEAINKPGDAKNEIILTQDITLGGDPTQYTLYTLSRGETTIKGGGNKITISNAGITVAKKGTVLNLGNPTEFESPLPNYPSFPIESIAAQIPKWA